MGFISAFSCSRLLVFLELPAPNGPCSAPAPLRSAAGAAPRMWQEPEILLRARKGCHNFPLVPSTSPFSTAHGRQGKKISEIAEGRVALGNRVPGEGDPHGEGFSSWPGASSSAGKCGEPEDGGMQALQGVALSHFSTPGNHRAMSLLTHGLVGISWNAGGSHGIIPTL